MNAASTANTSVEVPLYCAEQIKVPESLPVRRGVARARARVMAPGRGLRTRSGVVRARAPSASTSPPTRAPTRARR